MTLRSTDSLAVVGAGVAGCALAASLRRAGWTGSLALWESGRGPGGRTATRRSRRDPALRFDHGASLFNIAADPPPSLLAPLLASSAIERWPDGWARLDARGDLQAQPGRDPLAEGELFRGVGGMDGLCRGLLELAAAGPVPPASGQAPPPVQQHYGTLVGHLAITPQGRWLLSDRDQQPLGEADWLVLAGTLLAHPRSRLLLGWDTVPLQAAGRDRADPELLHALAALASIRYAARSNLLLLASGPEAEAWLACPFRLLRFDPAAEQRWRLSRLSIQPLDDGRVAVVAHSSSVFAAEHLSVYGSRSSIASQLGVQPRRQEEEAVIEALSEAVEGALAAWLAPGVVRRSDRQLMRWGAAFPLEPGLPIGLSLCRTSRVGFCGDYIEAVGFGRVEGALRSAERLAALLLGSDGPHSARG